MFVIYKNYAINLKNYSWPIEIDAPKYYKFSRLL